MSRAFGVAGPRLQERYLPPSEAYVRAAAMGWGVDVAPWIQVRDAVAHGARSVLGAPGSAPGRDGI